MPFTLAVDPTYLDHAPPWAWGIFGVIVLGALAADLLLFNRKADTRGIGTAAAWTAVWIGLAIAFYVGVRIYMGPQHAEEFALAYIIEKSLSVDNIFIFLVIFRYFGVPTVFQHRVLFWGILGALIMRGIMIAVGVQLIKLFSPILFVFAAFLVFTGVKLFFSNDESHDPAQTWAFRLTKRYVPMTDGFREEKFFVVEAGKRLATPLFMVLVVVEGTDLAFAVDSIPACLGITQDLFIVYTSNIFAILGLRALYFLLAGMMNTLRFLQPALAFVLVFIGLKMTLAELHKEQLADWAFVIPTKYSLGIVGGILFVAVVASLLLPSARKEAEAASVTTRGGELAGGSVTKEAE